MPKQTLLTLAFSGHGTDARLVRSIYALREALGDRSGDVVGTVYGEGYRILLPVFESAERPQRADDSRVGSAAAQDAIHTSLELLGGRTAVSLRLAEEAAQRASMLDPSCVPAWTHRAYLRLVMLKRGLLGWTGAEPELRTCIERALVLDPENAYARAMRGVYRALGQRDIEAAWSDLEYALMRDPENSRLIRLRGFVALVCGEPARALAEYEALHARAPLDAEVASNRAWALFLCGERAQAVSQLRAAAARWASTDVVHGTTALVALWTGQLEMALASSRRAVALSDGLPIFSAVLAYVLVHVGEPSEAHELLRQIESTGGGAHTIRALTLHELGERRAAREFEVHARLGDPAWSYLLGLQLHPHSRDPNPALERSATATAATVRD